MTGPFGGRRNESRDPVGQTSPDGTPGSEIRNPPPIQPPGIVPTGGERRVDQTRPPMEGGRGFEGPVLPVPRNPQEVTTGLNRHQEAFSRGLGMPITRGSGEFTVGDQHIRGPVTQHGGQFRVSDLGTGQQYTIHPRDGGGVSLVPIDRRGQPTGNPLEAAHVRGPRPVETQTMTPGDTTARPLPPGFRPTVSAPPPPDGALAAGAQDHRRPGRGEFRGEHPAATGGHFQPGGSGNPFQPGGVGHQHIAGEHQNPFQPGGHPHGPQNPFQPGGPGNPHVPGGPHNPFQPGGPGNPHVPGGPHNPFRPGDTGHPHAPGGPHTHFHPGGNPHVHEVPHHQFPPGGTGNPFAPGGPGNPLAPGGQPSDADMRRANRFMAHLDRMPEDRRQEALQRFFSNPANAGAGQELMRRPEFQERYGQVVTNLPRPTDTGSPTPSPPFRPPQTPQAETPGNRPPFVPAPVINPTPGGDPPGWRRPTRTDAMPPPGTPGGPGGGLTPETPRWGHRGFPQSPAPDGGVTGTGSGAGQRPGRVPGVPSDAPATPPGGRVQPGFNPPGDGTGLAPGRRPGRGDAGQEVPGGGTGGGGSGPHEGRRGPRTGELPPVPAGGPQGPEGRGPRGPEGRGPQGLEGRGPQGLEGRGPQGPEGRGLPGQIPGGRTGDRPTDVAAQGPTRPGEGGKVIPEGGKLPPGVDGKLSPGMEGRIPPGLPGRLEGGRPALDGRVPIADGGKPGLDIAGGGRPVPLESRPEVKQIFDVLKALGFDPYDREGRRSLVEALKARDTFFEPQNRSLDILRQTLPPDRLDLLHRILSRDLDAPGRATHELMLDPRRRVEITMQFSDRLTEILDARRRAGADSPPTPMDVVRALRDLNRELGLDPQRQGIIVRDLVARELLAGAQREIAATRTESPTFTVRMNPQQEAVLTAMLDRLESRRAEGLTVIQRTAQLEDRVDREVAARQIVDMAAKKQQQDANAAIKEKIDRAEARIEGLTIKIDQTQRQMAEQDLAARRQEITKQEEFPVRPEGAEKYSRTEEEAPSRRKKGEDEVTPAEAAIAAFFTSKIKDKAGKDKKEERSEEEDKRRKEKRRIYVVVDGDTLESIAKAQLGDSKLAHLIYRINKIPKKMQGGREVLVLKAGKILELPTASEVKAFRSEPGAGSLPPFEYASSCDTPGTMTAEEELAQRFGEKWSGDSAARSEMSEKVSSSSTSAAEEGRLGDRATDLLAARRFNVERMLGPLSSKKEEGPLMHTVRLGESIKSIATNHPALKDTSLWKLLAEVNGLPTETNDKGLPVAKVARGQKLRLPTPQEISQYRAQLRIQQSVASVPPTSFEIATKPCMGCGRMTTLTAEICPACGHSFSIEQPPASSQQPIASVNVEAAPHLSILAALDGVMPSGSAVDIASDPEVQSIAAEIAKDSRPLSRKEPEEEKVPVIHPGTFSGAASEFIKVPVERTEEMDAGLVRRKRAKPTTDQSVETAGSKVAKLASTGERPEVSIVDEKDPGMVLHQYNEVTRLVQYGSPGDLRNGTVFMIEQMIDGGWRYVVAYQVLPQHTVRLLYTRAGSTSQRDRMDLPAQTAMELAQNDLMTNWQAYCSCFLSSGTAQRGS